MSNDIGSIRSGQRTGAASAVNGSQTTSVSLSNGVNQTAEIDSDDLAQVGEAVAPESVTLADELALALGLGLTRHNPVWTSSALDRLRSLQHILMKCAFALPQANRGPVLAGVKSLELSVSLRLRLDEAIYAEQQATLRRSAPTESKDSESGGRSELTGNRARAA